MNKKYLVSMLLLGSIVVSVPVTSVRAMMSDMASDLTFAGDDVFVGGSRNNPERDSKDEGGNSGADDRGDSSFFGIVRLFKSWSGGGRDSDTQNDSRGPLVRRSPPDKGGVTAWDRQSDNPYATRCATRKRPPQDKNQRGGRRHSLSVGSNGDNGDNQPATNGCLWEEDGEVASDGEDKERADNGQTKRSNRAGGRWTNAARFVGDGVQPTNSDCGTFGLTQDRQGSSTALLVCNSDSDTETAPLVCNSDGDTEDDDNGENNGFGQRPWIWTRIQERYACQDDSVPAPWAGPIADEIMYGNVHQLARQYDGRFGRMLKTCLEGYSRHRRQDGEYQWRNKLIAQDPVYKYESGNYVEVEGLQAIMCEGNYYASTGENKPVLPARYDGRQQKFILINERLITDSINGKVLPLVFAHGELMYHDTKTNEYFTYGGQKLVMRSGSPVVGEDAYGNVFLLFDQGNGSEQAAEGSQPKRFKDVGGYDVALSCPLQECKTIAELTCYPAAVARGVVGVCASGAALMAYGTYKLGRKIFTKIRGTKPEADKPDVVKPEAAVEDKAVGTDNQDQVAAQTEASAEPVDASVKAEQGKDRADQQNKESRVSSTQAGAYDSCTLPQKAWIDGRIASLNRMNEKRGRVLTAHEIAAIRDAVAYQMYGARAPQTATAATTTVATVATTEATPPATAMGPAQAVRPTMNRTMRGRPVPIRRTYGAYKPRSA